MQERNPSLAERTRVRAHEDASESALGNGPKPKLIAMVIAIALAAVFLYYSLRGIYWREVWRLISGAKPLYVAGFCGWGTAALFLRAVRWRILLSSAGAV